VSHTLFSQFENCHRINCIDITSKLGLDETDVESSTPLCGRPVVYADRKAMVVWSADGNVTSSMAESNSIPLRTDFLGTEMIAGLTLISSAGLYLTL